MASVCVVSGPRCDLRLYFCVCGDTLVSAMISNWQEIKTL